MERNTTRSYTMDSSSETLLAFPTIEFLCALTHRITFKHSADAAVCWRCSQEKHPYNFSIGYLQV